MMMRQLSFFAVLILACASLVMAQSSTQTVAKYDFADLSSSLGTSTGSPSSSNEGYFTSSSSSDSASGSSASGLTSGLGGFNVSNHYGNSIPGLFFWGADPVNYGGGGSIQGAAWNGANGVQGPGNNSPYYFEFTVTPDAGQALSFADFAFDYFAEQNNLIGNYALYADEDPGNGGDNFGTQLNGNSAFSFYSWNTETVNLSGVSFLQNVTTAVTFRIYLWDDQSGWYTCDYVDNICVNASNQSTTGGGGGGGNPNCVSEFASVVVSNTPGANQTSATNPHDALGNDTSNHYSLGKGGNLVVAFSQAFSTTGDSGADICVDEFGVEDCYYICLEPADTFTLNAIQAAGWHQNSGNFWEPNGGLTYFCGDGALDIDAIAPGFSAGQLQFASVMVLDDNSSGDGAEVVSVEAKAICTPTNPVVCVPGFATGVVSSNQGAHALSGTSADPNSALGNNSHSFSLGASGNIVVNFGAPYSTSGDAQPDICIDENNDNDCYYLCFDPADTFTENALAAAGWSNFGGFWELTTQYCADTALDIDALVPGYTQGQLVFDAIMVLDDNSTSPLGDANGAEIVSVEAKFICGGVQPTTVKIGDTVFRDLNGNGGSQSMTDPGVSGVTVNLLDENGNPTGQSTTTDANGNYEFEVAPGLYIVEFVLPNGFVFTAQDNVSNDDNDSDANVDTGRTGVIDVTDGDDDLSIDAGLLELGKIGDLVFEDLNGNGQQDAGEPGVANVTVTLLDGNGNPTGQSTTTDNDGNYEFVVEPGDYIVQVGAPGDLEFTTQNAGDDATDSDVDANGTTGVIHIDQGEEDLSVDAGLVELAKIGNLVFEDLNGNGIKNAGEPGVSGVVVELLDANGQPTGATETTNGNGIYQFCVTPGTYAVSFTLPNGFQFTQQDAGTNEGNDSDADANGVTGFVTVESGDTNNQVDAGILALATIGDFVFEDLNGNGQQDPGEPGVAGATVALLDENGQPTGDTVTTGADGAYSFPVEPGTYSVQFTLPTGLNFTDANVGPDGTDSDADPITGTSAPVTVSSGDSIDTIDAGATAPAKIGNFVFEDLNGNGSQNPGEPGIGGATVTVLDANGQPTGITATTANDGSYEVCVEPGDYILAFTLPGGFDFTNPNQGNDALDSDADQVNGQTGVITVQSGDVNNDVDAGGLAAAKLGNFVFEDLNGNGLQDGGEPGVGGVTVVLLDENGNPTGQSVITGPDGLYEFSVNPGTYSVVFQLPTGVEFTTANAGNDNLDSDANATTGATAQVTLESGDTNFDLDAGVIAIAKIGDFVFEDVNGNGQQDAGEPGLAGITVTLLDGDGNPTGQSVVSGGDGSYLFCVTPGDYIVGFTPSNGLEFTDANVGGDAGDSDADPTTGLTGVITVQSGDDIDNVDAGLIALAKIGDLVFEDLNGNGQQDAGEPGVSGVQILLLDGQGSPTGESAVTDGAGGYQFCVEPGDYIVAFGLPNGVQFTTANVGNDASDSDANPSNGRTGVITVASGDMNFDVDAGVLAIAKIGNFVFEDLNGNGQQNAGEPGVGGVNVILLDANGQSIDSTNTGTDGSYQFCVEPGTYTVVFSTPNGFVFTDANVGGDAGDSDANPADGSTGPITVQSGDVNNDVDAGVLTPAKLGNFVFEDLNGNGQQDAGEPGIPNVTVSVVDATNGQTVETQQSGGDGSYLFCVEPGTYFINFDKPNGFNFTNPNVGSDATDSDADGNGDTTPVTVGSGDVIDTIDAGLLQPATIGNFVFEDLDTDGEQDLNEPGVGGVIVFLLDENGVPTGDQTQTDGSGFYSFTVEPGTYGVTFLAPSGFRFTVSNNSTDDLDSDANPSNGTTAPIAVGSGESNLTLDAGIVELPNPTDFVYPDQVCGFDDNGFPIPGDPTQATGAPNGQSVGLGNGGCISLCRTCQFITTTGDSAADIADIAIFEFGDVDDYIVELLPANISTEMALQAGGFADSDGNGYYEVGTFYGAVGFDLDALLPGFQPGELIFAQVKITDVPGGANLIADVDAVGFAQVVNIPNSVDPSGLVHADYVRFTRDFQLGTGTVDPNQNVLAIEGMMDDVSLSLGEGGCITTGFLGAWFSNSGDAEGDVFVFEEGEDEGYFVGLCPADAFTEQALIAAGYTDPSGTGCYIVFDDPCPGDLSLDIDAVLPGFEKGQLAFDELKIFDDNIGPNTSPNSGADIDAVAMTTRILPGTGSNDDWLLETALNGGPKGDCPADIEVMGGDVLEIEISSPSGLYDGIPYLVGAMCVPTGMPITPPIAFPGVWLNPDRAPVFFLWQDPFAMPQDMCIPIPIPMGLSDICCTIQAFGLTSTAPNGLFIASNAFELCHD
jgi:SdrD B-like domain